MDKRNQYNIALAKSLTLEQQLSLIRKILKNNSLVYIAVTAENSKSLGKLESAHSDKMKILEIIRKK